MLRKTESTGLVKDWQTLYHHTSYYDVRSKCAQKGSWQENSHILKLQANVRLPCYTLFRFRSGNKSYRLIANEFFSFFFCSLFLLFNFWYFWFLSFDLRTLISFVSFVRLTRTVKLINMRHVRLCLALSKSFSNFSTFLGKKTVGCGITFRFKYQKWTV